MTDQTVYSEQEYVTALKAVQSKWHCPRCGDFFDEQKESVLHFIFEHLLDDKPRS